MRKMHPNLQLQPTAFLNGRRPSPRKERSKHDARRQVETVTFWRCGTEGTNLREAGIRDLVFIPTEVMSQFVQVGNFNLVKKQGSPVVCWLWPGLPKEGDRRYFVRLSRWTVDQRIPFENAQACAISASRWLEKHRDLHIARARIDSSKVR